MTAVLPSADRSVVLAAVRQSVRGILEGMPGYRSATQAKQREAAKSMVTIAMTAADLVAEELEQDGVVRSQPKRGAAVLSEAQAIGDTASAGAQAVEQLRDAVDFPTFVQSLITGVFNAISNANVAQFERFGQLVSAVSQSTPDFARTAINNTAAVGWAIGAFPGLRRTDDGGLEMAEDVDFDDIRVGVGRALGLSETETSEIQGDELVETLLPLVKRKMAQDRQRMLASMVKLGLQRIVVDEGRIHASMDLRVDTSAVRERQTDDRTDVRVNAAASGGWGWGSASVATTVGYVKSDSQYSNDQINSQAGLRSTVDLAFRTEQVPLDRVATPAQRATITARAPTPVDVGSNTASTQRRLTRPTLAAIPAPPTPPPVPTAPPTPAAATPAPAAQNPVTT